MKKLRFLAKIWAIIKALFSKIDKVADKALEIAVKGTQGVKKAVESKVFADTKEFLKLLLPDAGDAVVDKVYDTSIELLPKLAARLEIISEKDAITVENFEEIFRKILGVKNDALWEKFWTQFAQELMTIFADGKVTWAETGIAVKTYYDTYLKGK